MIERISSDNSLRRVSPLDVARVVMQRRGVDLGEHLEAPAFSPADHIAGDIIERDGKEYMLTPVLRTAEGWKDGERVYSKLPYTYRQYYSHTFEEPGSSRMVPGPGWDSRFHLYDKDTARLLHDRTFSPEELESLPASLPDTDCLFVSDMEGGRVAEYREYLEDINS